MAAPSTTSYLLTIPTKISYLVQRLQWLLLAMYSVVLWDSLLSLAKERLLWHDELFTYYMAQLPGYTAIWNGLSGGLEIHPPLSYWLVHLSHSIAGKSEWATRLPVIVAFWLTTLIMYWIVARATDAVHGFIAMLLPSLTMGVYFAYEARGYAIATMFSASAILFWQMSKSGIGRPWTPALVGLSIAGACYSHYYGILLLAPFSIAELAWSRRNNRLDRQIWLSLAAGAASTLPLLPLMRSASRSSSTFWSAYKGAWPVTKAYFELFWKPMVLVGLVSLAADQFIRRDPPPVLPSEGEDVMLTASGGILAAGFALMPACCLILAYAVTHAFIGRYVLFSVTGVIVALVLSFFRRYGHQPAIAVALLALASATAIVEVHVRRERLEEQSTEQPLSAGTRELVKVLEGLESRPLEPILLAEHLFLPAWHYGSPSIRPRLAWLLEDEKNSWGIAARAFAPIDNMPIVTVEDAALKYSRFYLFRPNSGILDQLKAKGFRFEAETRVLLLASKPGTVN